MSLHLLTSLNDESTDEEMNFAWNSLSEKTFMITEFPKDFCIHRARLNENNWPLVKTSHCISYIHNSPEEHVKIGRCNSKGKPVFYGSFYLEQNGHDYRESVFTTALKEVSYAQRHNFKNVSRLKEKGYVGIWHSTATISAIALLNYQFTQEHGSWNDGREFLKNFLNRNAKDFEYMWKIYGFISKAFAKTYSESNPNNYRLSSFLAEKLFERCNALIFPSVASQGECPNIAIKLPTADSLKLHSVIKVELESCRQQNGIEMHIGRHLICKDIFYDMEDSTEARILQSFLESN